jgi:hypothetical protein
VDSTRNRDYASWSMNRRSLVRWLVLPLPLLATLAQAAEPALLTLAYSYRGAAVQLPVSAAAGAYASPNAGQAAERWRVLPAHRLRGGPQPPDRSVELFNGPAPGTLLARIEVRYFRAAHGDWVPHFQLNEIPLVMRDGKGWRPITAFAGAALVVTSNSLPNVAGYYPWLEVGLGSGPASIDSWVVR